MPRKKSTKTTDGFKRDGNAPNTVNLTEAEVKFADMAANVMSDRSALWRRFLDPRRDIDDECGYPKTGNIERADYRNLYDREPIATRVVEVLPMECWKVQPELYETEDIDQDTDFEKRWAEASGGLRGSSWYKGSEGSPIWEHLRRVDILSGVGSFGVLLIGIDDGLELYEPVDGINEAGEMVGTPKESTLLYLRSFDESLAEIAAYETDVNNPRFDQPVLYNLTFSGHDNSTNAAPKAELTTKKVHWTRVIHVADNLGSSEIYGAPRMRPVLNRLYDLVKLYGGSAEMYWRGAFPGISFETHPSLGGDVKIGDEEKTAMRTQVEDYMNKLQRYFTLLGMTAKSLAPQVVDPTQQITVQIEAICVQLAVPKRIFMGSERGELASSQDGDTWKTRLSGRQSGYITPRIIVPFIDRLIMIGVLPQPGEDGYSIVWPDLDQASEIDQSKVALTRTQSLSAYVMGGVDALVPPLDFLVDVIGFKKDKAEEMVNAAMDAIAELEAETEAMLEEGNDEGQQAGAAVPADPGGTRPTESGNPPQSR